MYAWGWVLMSLFVQVVTTMGWFMKGETCFFTRAQNMLLRHSTFDRTPRSVSLLPYSVSTTAILLSYKLSFASPDEMVNSSVIFFFYSLTLARSHIRPVVTRTVCTIDGSKQNRSTAVQSVDVECSLWRRLSQNKTISLKVFFVVMPRVL